MKRLLDKVNQIVNIPYLWILVVILAGFAVRLYKINTPIADWHSWRQVDTASVSRIFLDEGVEFLRPRYYDISSIQTGFHNPDGLRMVELPVFNVIHVYLAKTITFLSFEVVGRLVSIFSAMVSAIMLFLIGEKIIGKWGGVLAAFFFLFIPYNIYFTRVVLPEPLATSFALVSLWLFIKYLDKESMAILILSGIFYALSLLVKPFTIFYSSAFTFLVYWKYELKMLKDHKKLIKLLIFGNIVALPLFLWRIWINRFPIGIAHFEWMFNGDEIRFRPAFWRWILGERIGKLILGVWGLIPLAFGIVSSKKRNLFHIFFFGGVILYTIVVATANVRHDYYQTFLIPPIALLLAKGALHLWKSENYYKVISRFLLLTSIVMMFGMAYYRVKDFYQINHPEIIEAGEAVDRLVPEDALVIAPYNGDTAFLYHTKRYGWPAIDDSLERLVDQGADYYVSVNLGDSDTKYVIQNYKVVENTGTYLVADLNSKLNP